MVIIATARMNDYDWDKVIWVVLPGGLGCNSGPSRSIYVVINDRVSCFLNLEAHILLLWCKYIHFPFSIYKVFSMAGNAINIELHL